MVVKDSKQLSLQLSTQVLILLELFSNLSAIDA